MRFPFEKQWTIPDHAPFCAGLFCHPLLRSERSFYSYKADHCGNRISRRMVATLSAFIPFIMCTRRQPATAGVTNASVIRRLYAVRLGVPAGECHRGKSIPEHLRETFITHGRSFRRGTSRHPTLVTLDLYTRRAAATAPEVGWRDFYWLSAYSSGVSGMATNGCGPFALSALTCMKSWRWSTASWSAGPNVFDEPG